MKKLSVRAAVAAAFAINVFCAAAAVQTNQWVGAAAGGSWSTLTNWKVLPDGGNPEGTALTSGGCVWDLSTLADGATVTDDVANLVIGGLVFGENQGTVTLSRSGSETVNCTTPGDTTAFVTPVRVPTGTTVSFKLVHGTTPWKAHTFDISGPGTFRFDSTSWGSLPWSVNITDATFIHGSDSYNQAFAHAGSIYFKSASAKLKLERNATVNAIKSDGGVASQVDLNGFVLTVRGAQSAVTYSGDVIGTGASGFSLYNIPLTFGHDLAFSGTLSLMNGDAFFGSAGSPVSLSGQPALVAAAEGRANFYADQTVKSLSGNGRESGVTIASGKTFTAGVAGTTAVQTFAGRIDGEGGFAKDGSGYSLTMSGANAYGGATRVKAGELVLRRPAAAEGLVAYYDFDNDPSDAKAVDRVSGTPKDMYPMYDQWQPAHEAGGINGSTCIHFDDSKYELDASRVGYYIPFKDRLAQGSDFTFLVWIKVDPATDWSTKGTSAQVAEIFYTGGWDANSIWCHLRKNVFYFGGCGAKDLSYTTPAANCVTNGAWHQVGIAWSNETGKRYLIYDGAYVKEAEISIVFANPANLYLGSRANPSEGIDQIFNGWMDNFEAWNRKLTAEEVASAFTSHCPPVAAVALPDPVAHWTFEEASGNTVKDVTGNGHDLTFVSGCSIVTDAKGAYGNTLYANSTGSATASLPSEIAGKHDFTFSCRYLPRSTAEGVGVFGFGDYTTANKFFMINNNSYPSYPGIKYANPTTTGADISISDWRVYGQNNRCGWFDMICVYSASAKTVDVYLDGSNVLHKTGVALDLGAGENTVHLGSLPSDATKTLSANFDDVRLYDVALSAAQVSELARSIRPEVDSNVIPSTSAVTVDEGATLTIDAPTQTLASLSGAGQVKLTSVSTLKLSGASGFTGGFTGGVLDLQNGYEFALKAGDATPALTSTGIVKLPTSAKLVFDAPLEQSGNYTVVSAGKIEAPANFDGWTVEPADGVRKCRFSVVDGELKVRVSVAGLVLLFK